MGKYLIYQISRNDKQKAALKKSSIVAYKPFVLLSRVNKNSYILEDRSGQIHVILTYYVVEKNDSYKVQLYKILVISSISAISKGNEDAAHCHIRIFRKQISSDNLIYPKPNLVGHTFLL